jgi:hypothetical protein
MEIFNILCCSVEAGEILEDGLTILSNGLKSNEDLKTGMKGKRENGTTGPAEGERGII